MTRRTASRRLAVCVWSTTVICATYGLTAEEFSNRWPVKKQYADPAVTAAMEAVRAAIPQAAKDPTRPVYHFRPAARWMNDPCGAIHHKGYYHVFYQLNPTGDSDWGRNNSHWGHTRSKTLDAAGTKLPLQLDNDQPTLTLHVFLDGSVMEVFADGGRECITRVVYPGEGDLGIEVFAEGGTGRLESMDVWEMKSIW